MGPAGILPADKCAKATGKMPVFPTAKMAVPNRLARFSTKLKSDKRCLLSRGALGDEESCGNCGRKKETTGHDKT